MINVRLCRPISKYLRSIKIQGKRTPDGSKQIKSTAEQFFGKASGTKSKERVTNSTRTALLTIHTLFSFNKNVVFPAQASIFLVSCQF